MDEKFKNICEAFNKDMEEYLKVAFLDADLCKIKETASYATNRMAINIFDVILKRDADWRDEYMNLLKINFKTSELLRREIYNGK